MNVNRIAASSLTVLLVTASLAAAGADFYQIRGGIPNSQHYFKADISGNQYLFFLGNSVLAGTGLKDANLRYSAQMVKGFKKHFPASAIIETRHMQPGGSWFGLYRCSRGQAVFGEVICSGHLAILDFAADDRGADIERVKASLEGLVRQVFLYRATHSQILVTTLTPEMLQAYQAGKTPEYIQVGEQIAEVLRLKRALTPAQSAQAAIDLLAKTGIPEPARRAGAYPHQLSGGQRQRAMIAMALACKPKLLIADEPTTALDVTTQVEVLAAMRRIVEEFNTAAIYITHDLASARYIGDEIMVMYAGHMVEGGNSEAIMKEPAHPYTQLLLSAVPDPRAGLHTDRNAKARGEVPSLIDPPPGCPFAARCPRVLKICHQVMPRPARVSEGHWVRCNLFDPKG